MHAHKFRMAVSEDRVVQVRLPSDFPPGEVDVIVLATSEQTVARSPLVQTQISTEFAQRHPHAGTFGPVVFHEDPTAPLDAEYWGDKLG